MLAFKARKRGVTATSTTAAILDFSQTTPFWSAVWHCRLGAGLAAKEGRCISDLTCRRQGGKTADWLLISRVILLSADLSVTAQQSLKNCEFFTSVTQQIQQEMQK